MSSNEWYVDPVSGSNANGGTSDADAWATIQYALDTITQSTTDGDYLNLKSSGTHTLTANIDWSGITRDVTYPFTVRGYTSSAGDGGLATVECNGYKYMVDASIFYILTSNIKFQNTGTGVNDAFVGGYNILYKDCTWENFDTGSSTGRVLYFSGSGYEKASILRCTFTDINGYAITTAMQQFYITGCHFYNSGTKDMNAAIYAVTSTEMPVITECIFNLDSTSDAIYCGTTGTQGLRVINNTFFTSGTGTAIYNPSNTYGAIIENNIFEGWDKAIDFDNTNNFTGYSLINNYFYDNTIDIDATTYRLFVFDEGNFKASGSSCLAKSGSNTHANRATYFAPIGDAVGGATDGIHDIGAMPAISSGSGSGNTGKRVGFGGGLIG